MGPFPFAAVVVCLIAGLLAPAAAAQADAGPDPCDPTCVGDVLHFCDGDTPVELDCRDLEGRCGLLSADWGADCILGNGAACDPGYAFGVSRCDAAAGVYCVNGSCAEASGPSREGDEEPTPGTEVVATDVSTNPFGCADCGGGGQGALLLPTLWMLRRRRR